MIRLPKAAEPLISAFSVAFTRPTFQRVVVLILGAILSLRQRTVTGMLRAIGPLARGHFSDFHRVLCRARWSTWPLGKVLAAMILELIPRDQAVVVPVDDTAVQHRGKVAAATAGITMRSAPRTITWSGCGGTSG